MACRYKHFLLIALLLAVPVLADQAASIRATSAAQEDGDEDPFYRYEVNSGLGIHVLDGSGMSVSGQFGYAAFGQHPIYLGMEMNFAFVQSGTLFGIWPGGWYEHRLSSAPKLSFLFGALGGPSFTTNVALLPTTTWAAFLDLGVQREIDDLASLRVQLRPGVDGGRFAFLTALIVSFRFL